MKLFIITIAYCPAALLARSLTLYQKTRSLVPYRHIVVQGHYPINRAKNNNDIKLITECFDGIELWDPGENLGSAQSQNWALKKLDITPNDFFINLDPDSACLQHNWDYAMKSVLEADENCALISCNAPMVQRYSHQANAPFQIVDNDGVPRYGIPSLPTPFNLSMWRYSFIKEIGGIPQMGLFWGETEAPFYAACQQRGKYHAYLLDFMENEHGKFMQDRQQNEWKDFHMRVSADKQFLGNFEEFLRAKYPNLLEIDTCKDLTNFNHP